MIFHPPILALLAASLLSTVVLVVAGGFAVRLLRHWDPTSGSHRQIELERATTLVSTVVAFVLATEATSLVLFAVNADRMAPLFVGAMCAVGTLAADPWGFPALWAKIAVFFAAFVWLALDRIDATSRDWALIRPKYVGLLSLVPLVVAESGLELAYFLGLRPATVTSCCGKLFGETRADVGGDLAAFDPRLSLILLAAALAVAVVAGGLAGRNRHFAVVQAAASIAVFAAALVAIVAAIGPYVYELPHHHCPFCILKREYGHVGFLLYAPLFVATGAGLAAGAATLLTGRADGRFDEGAVRRLSKTAVAGHVLFAAFVVLLILRSGLVLIGP